MLPETPSEERGKLCKASFFLCLLRARGDPGVVCDSYSEAVHLTCEMQYRFCLLCLPSSSVSTQPLFYTINTVLALDVCTSTCIPGAHAPAFFTPRTPVHTSYIAACGPGGVLQGCVGVLPANLSRRWHKGQFTKLLQIYQACCIYPIFFRQDDDSFVVFCSKFIRRVRPRNE